MTRSRDDARAARPRLSFRKRLAFSVILPLLLLAVLEPVSRAYWWNKVREKGVSFFDPDLVVRAFYPELVKKSLLKARSRSDDKFDVLLLGASVLKDNWTDVESILKEELEKRFGENFAIHNMARSGHTSMDSLHKYILLDEHRFDLVVLYHSINEVRANNCRPENYRDDYSHMAWYANSNFVVEHRSLGRFLTLPATLHSVYLLFLHYANVREFLPLKYVVADHLPYGSDIKTPRAYEGHMRSILDIAADREDPLLLMTFAYYVPADYSAEGFAAKRLDYYKTPKQSVPIEFWGLPENAVRTLDAHNEAVRRLHEETGPAYFIDMAEKMPKDGRCWSDICHFSPEGSRIFVETIFREIGNETMVP